jgi:hypothetical protein
MTTAEARGPAAPREKSFRATRRLDQTHCVRDRVLCAAITIHLRHDDRRDALRLASLEVRLPILESEVDAERSIDARHDRRLGEVPTPHLHQAGALRLNRGDDGLRSSFDDRTNGLCHHPPEPAYADADHSATDDDRSECRDAAAGDQHLPATSPTELVAVSPRRELRSEWFADSNQLGSIAHGRESDVVGRHSASRVGVETVGFLDRLPTLFERRQVPALALPADDPQPTLRRVERQAASDGKRLERLIGAERLVAEKTG